MKKNENKGQILIDSKMGSWIKYLASLDEVQTILEIGTWYGLGSTYCIVQGLRMRKRKNPIKIGYSMEIDKERYEEAKKNLYPLPENFHLLNASPVSIDEMIDLYETIQSDRRKKWSYQDIQIIRSQKVPICINPIEDIIDLCILDGGTTTGFLEFERFGKRAKYLVLDDTMVAKHEKTRQYILNSNEFTVLEDNTKARNGFMICKNNSL